MIHLTVFLVAFISMPVIIIVSHRASMRRRVQRARAIFAEAYNAWQRATHDPYTGDVPALHASAEKAGWDLARIKRNA